MNDLLLVGKALHAEAGIPLQDLALMITHHPDIPHLAGRPVVLVHEIEEESPAPCFLQAGIDGHPPLLGEIWRLQSVPGMQECTINVLIYHLPDLLLDSLAV